MKQRLRRMIRKEFTQTLRDPRMRAMLFLPPLIQLLIFGFAVNLDVDSAKVAWMDQDRTPESRELLSEFQGSGRFAIAAMPASESEMQDLLDRGRIDGVIRVLPGFARDIRRGRPTSVQVLLDGTNSNTASIVSAYAGQAIQRYAAEVMTQRQRAKTRRRRHDNGSGRSHHETVSCDRSNYGGVRLERRRAGLV
jgi:ABC-2 type transport system permease protein